MITLVSEKLRDSFGEIRLEIIFQNKTTRVSCIRRVSDNEVLSFHIVLFSEAGIERLGPAHEKIVAGGLLGEVIKESGVSYTRTVSDKSFVDMDAGLASLFATVGGRCTTERIEYQVREVPYATIYEFYNPKYTPVAELSSPLDKVVRALMQKHLVK